MTGVGWGKAHRGAERVRGDVPARAEDEQVRERVVRDLRLGGEHAEDGGVDVVLRDAAHVHELLHRVLVRHVAARRRVVCDRIRGVGVGVGVVLLTALGQGGEGGENGGDVLAGPGDDVEGRMFLLTRKHLPADPINQPPPVSPS